MDSIYAAALCSIDGFGAAKVRQLIERFGSAEAAWRAEPDEVVPAGCIRLQDCRKFIAGRAVFSVDKLAVKLEQAEIKLCSWRDDDYPVYLRNIHNPPAVLFYRGDLGCLKNCLAVVGSRRATVYGRTTAEQLAAAMAAYGVTIVSGAARGIDTAAHKGALLHGRTAAVLGCGVDVAYPRENRRLMDNIAESGGIVLSEYLPGTEPLAKHFPARNRIIAGLSRALLVVEAGVKSGSLITAEFALEEGRSVLAVPGSIYAENSRGCHKLIKQGARLVDNINDILAEYEEYNVSIKPVAALPSQELSLAEQAVYDVLSDTQALSVDEIIIKTSRRADNIAYLLLQLELKGLVKQELPFSYVRVCKEAFM